MIETKVKTSTGAALAAGIADWLLGKYILNGADPAIAAQIYAAVPAMLVFAAGWLAPHTRQPAPPPVTPPEKPPAS